MSDKTSLGGRTNQQKKIKEKLELELLEIQERKLKLQLELCEKESLNEDAEKRSLEEVESNLSEAYTEPYTDRVASNHRNLKEVENNFSEPYTDRVQKWINYNPTMKQEKSADVHKYLIRQAVNKDLPIFHGDPIEWPSFISQFNETTKICGFSSRENLSRLQKSLKGKAHESVRYLLNFPEQLDKIISVLERRFGRAELIIEEILEKIKDVPYVKEYDHEGLIELSNHVLNLVITIENLNCHGHLMNPQITKELINKLSPNLRLQWGSQLIKTGKCSNLKDFSSWLEELAEAASVVVTKRKLEKKKVHASYEMSSNVKPKSTENKLKCIFCEKIGEHNIVNCHKFKDLSPAQRWNVVKTKKICFYCLRDNHQLKFCKYKKECGINNCTKFHNKLLHDNSTSTSGAAETIITIEPNFTTTNRQEKNYVTILKILPVQLIGPKGKMNTFALLDDASTVTLLDEEVSNKLGLQGVPKPLCLQWTNDLTTSFEKSKQVSVEITGQFNSNKTHILKNVRTMKNLNLVEQNIDVKMFEKRWPYIKNVNLGNLRQAKPTILIGQDNWTFLISRNFIRRKFDEPVLTKTRLGWVLHGNVRLDSESEITTSYCTPVVCNHTTEEDNLTALVELSFKLERDGLDVKMDTKSEKTERAMKILIETTKRVGNRFESGLLWKYDNIQLPDSRELAFQRLKCMERKMDKNKNFAEKYCQKFEEYMEKGYIRKVPENKINEADHKIWYLPHFGVINPNKPEKLRLVFDAAAKVNGVSLNNNLLPGPDLLTNLTEILWKFRQRKIAFCGDIKEMFHQILIRDEYCYAQRLLWRGLERNKSPEVYEMKAMTFGAACSPSIAQYVKNKNAEENREEFPEVADAIIKKHYVDDYLDCACTEEEAIKQILGVIEVHRRGGFEICNWISNSRTVLEKIPENLRAKTNKSLNPYFKQPVERILGMWWLPECDHFTFHPNFHKVDEEIITGKKKPTKRNILKTAMSVFDPLGLLSPLTVKIKILLQETWKIGIGWDDIVPEHLEKQWQKWLEELRKITTFSIPRCYSNTLFKFGRRIELHGFSDASEKAICSVVYLRIIDQENNYETFFVSAKSRVAPLKVTTIPKLELQAALILSQLTSNIIKNLEVKFNEIYLWTDSTTVIQWLKHSPRKVLNTYVGRRVEEILKLTKLQDWHWISSKENVADDSTRENCSDYAPGSRWLSGPPFLRLPKEQWPRSAQTNLCLYTNITQDKEEKILMTKLTEGIPKEDRFSKYEKLLRCTAWILRFINNSKRTSNQTGELTPLELDKAEKIWIKCSQEASFPNELRDLQREREIKKSSRLNNLTPVLEDGILRVKGRLNNEKTYLNEDTKKPIILDPKHKFTKLLLDFYHRKMNHMGQETVINEIKQKFWVIKIRNAVRKCKLECNYCKKQQTKPVTPEMGQLPMDRLTGFTRPFSITGMDYFGPMTITVGRKHEKRYGVIFTCMSVRAVHLELANNLTTDSTIMALRRFMCRRGKPAKLYSDNGTNLRGADKELCESIKELDQKKITQELSQNGIEWHFNPPAAPHMGGAWERLIRSVKTSLKTVLKEKYPKEEVLRTFLVETENIINCRPLTKASEDPDDETCLTPNHFLVGSSDGAPPQGNFENQDFNLRKQWRVSQALAEMFWRRWYKEYIPSLNERKKWTDNKKNAVNVNDVVIIVEKNVPRNEWPLGVVVKIFPGPDNIVRVVDVKTKNGVLKRPVHQLCKLV